MAEQSVDLRSALSILRRRRLLLVLAAMLGVMAGLAFVVEQPSMYSSRSSVLLPPVKPVDGQVPARDMKTEVRVATSDVVLGPAGATLSPPMSAQALGRFVRVSASTTDVLDVVAKADTAARAEAISRAVAAAEVAYVTRSGSSLTSAETTALQKRQQELEGSLATVNAEIKKTQARLTAEDPASTQGQADAAALAQLTAQQASLVLQIDGVKQKSVDSQPLGGASVFDKSPAKRPGLVERSIVFAMVGLLLAEALAALVLILSGKRDRRLRYRDEIADALGTPVLASVRSRAPRNVAGWGSLLESYAPGTVDAWALRQAMRQLALTASGGARPGERGEGLLHPPSITVIVLSGDVKALAMAPQLAAYAAGSGLRTALVAAQRHESAAALWAACSGDRSEVRPGLLVDTEQPEGQPDEQPDGLSRAETEARPVPEVGDVELTVVLAVVDRAEPEVADVSGVRDSSVTVLAVSSGFATAEELALAAVKADDAGCRIDGILVADPDDLDRTTGRLLQHERAQQVSLPTHLTGIPGSAPGSNVSGLRRRPR